MDTLNQSATHRERCIQKRVCLPEEDKPYSGLFSLSLLSKRGAHKNSNVYMPNFSQLMPEEINPSGGQGDKSSSAGRPSDLGWTHCGACRGIAGTGWWATSPWSIKAPPSCLLKMWFLPKKY